MLESEGLSLNATIGATRRTTLTDGSHPIWGWIHPSSCQCDLGPIQSAEADPQGGEECRKRVIDFHCRDVPGNEAPHASLHR